MLGFSSTSTIFTANTPTAITANNPVNMQIINTLLIKSELQNNVKVQSNDIPFSIPVDIEFGKYQQYIHAIEGQNEVVLKDG